MKLQKMKYLNSGSVVCAVDETRGSSFTVCGNVFKDEDLSDDYVCWDVEGPIFEGSLRDVSCPACLRIISFINGLR